MLICTFFIWVFFYTKYLCNLNSQSTKATQAIQSSLSFWSYMPFPSILILRSKIFGSSKLFWKGTNYKLFSSGTMRFGRVQIILVRFKLKFSELLLITWSGPKWFRPIDGQGISLFLLFYLILFVFLLDLLLVLVDFTLLSLRNFYYFKESNLFRWLWTTFIKSSLMIFQLFTLSLYSCSIEFKKMKA